MYDISWTGNGQVYLIRPLLWSLGSRLGNLSENHSGYSRDLLQAVLEFIESYNQLIWYEVTLIVTTFAA